MADDTNDTGSAGFDIDGKTYAMDVGRPGEQAGHYGPYVKKVNADGSFIDENGRPKDISRSTRTTLGKYLSDVTLAKRGSATKPNKYPVSPNGAGETKSITDTNGNPVGPAPADSVNDKVFGGKVDPYSQQYPVIQPNLQKGKALASPGAKDGHDFLKGADGSDSSPLGTYRSAILANNRFTAAQGRTYNDAGTGAAGFNPGMPKQTTMGTYDKGASAVTPERMALIGPLLTLRAGKELNAAANGTNPNSGGLKAASILPGLGQLGVTRIDQQVLTAADVLDGLTDAGLEEPFVISPGSLSWGQLNNVNDPYDGTDALGMLALSTALVAGVELLFDALSLLLGLVTPSLKTAARDSQGRYSLGEYLPGSKNARKAIKGGIGGALAALSKLNFGALLGTQPTNFPFSRALTTGMNAFFQVPDSGGGSIGLNQLAGAVGSSLDSPGFNVVVARAIIRSSLTIVDQLGKIGGNVMNAVNQTLALVDVIRRSKLIAACNIFASLGDALLSNLDDYKDEDAANTKVSTMDAQPDNPNAVSKNRLKGTLKLAWAGNRAQSNLLLPASVYAAALSVKDMGQPGVGVGIQVDPHSNTKVTVVGKKDMGRISAKDAFEFEQRLEASYVPFYFHDIRTNEMVSFHAFLASLSDDYNVNFDRSDGFGRVEPVKIYKGTERKIGMSFYVIATSVQDFDEMYLKINKLVTLVYPQYTQGLTLSDASGNNVFTQPFSQLVGASPLIRIRLGDLIRSNYSLFALGRLFGMGNPDFKIDGFQFTDGDKIDQGALDEYKAKVQDLLKDPVGKKFYPLAGTNRYQYYPDETSGGGGISVPVPKVPGMGNSDKGPKFAPEFDPGGCPWKGAFMVKVKKLHPDNPFLVIGEVQPNDDVGHSEDPKVGSPGLKKYLEQNYSNDDLPLKKVIGGTYVFPITALVPTPTTLQQVASNISALTSLTSDSKFFEKLSEFLDPEKNAVVKSFQDTGGKGLAGFIESMNFDWYDKVTWETEHGRIAPKMCKVTITFSPIHDISPGIDHHGFNRAPVYPVGPWHTGDAPFGKPTK